jgi:hypothetical protein
MLIHVSDFFCILWFLNDFIQDHNAILGRFLRFVFCDDIQKDLPHVPIEDGAQI